MRLSEVDFGALVKAVIKQESDENPKAVSRVGAKGLMQLMDATGREWHRILDIKEPYDPFNSQQNVRIGKAYLRWLIEHFDDVELGLAAYNGGMGNVGRTIRKIGSKKWEDVRENLENKDGEKLEETIEYVPKVLKIYRRLVTPCTA